MKNCLFVIFISVMFMLVLSPLRVNALSYKDFNFSDSVSVLAKTNNNANSGQKIDSTCNGLLGNPSDPDSVAWLLQLILNYIKIIGPVLVVVLSSVDFMKCIIKSDDDAMVKAQKKLTTRLILAALLFFIPTMANAILGVFGIYGDPTCNVR